MGKKVTAVFDVGKTNKKFFLFDSDFAEVYREYKVFEEIEDEDGHPTEDIDALTFWMKATLNKALSSSEYEITSLNFSSYGASLVHLNDKGEMATPMYNYIKPMPQEIISKFYDVYGPEIDFAMCSGSSNSGLLNSGMQLYWLKHTKPDIFDSIATSLHLPQYLSYIFTGKMVSDYTSIGCHTALWDYSNQDYHEWVLKEGIAKKLPSIVPTNHYEMIEIRGKKIKVGVGIHDSSAALLPYLRSSENKFVLLSTGTWSIALNPFSDGILSRGDIAADCINYMRVNGSAVKASRLFLGYEFTQQLKDLAEHFNVSEDLPKHLQFNEVLYRRVSEAFRPKFRWKDLAVPSKVNQTDYSFESFEEGYHQLLFELVKHQAARIKTTIGQDAITELYIDGGFAANAVFMEMLHRFLPKLQLKTTDASLGSALGAALVVSDVTLDTDFLRTKYALKSHNNQLTEN